MERLSHIKPPTREEFADFQRLTSKVGEQPLLAFKDGRPEFDWVSDPLQDAESVLTLLEEAWMQCGKLIEISAVGIWLSAHPTSERAWAAAHRASKSVSLPDPVSARAREIVESCYRVRTLEDITGTYGPTIRRGGAEVQRTPQDFQDLVEIENSTGRRNRRIERHLEWLAKQDVYGVSRGVAAAFEDYFYGSSFVRHAVKPAELRKQASELLEAIAVIEDPARWGAIGMEPLKLAAYHRRKTDQLRGLLDNPPLSPIKKLDGTAPDRFLAYSLWRVFQRAYRSNRTTAIYNFMQFYGVKNTPDARSVERWVKDWRRDSRKNRETGGNSS
ncbi:hypothetical protein [Luteimonas sp. 3794]|uniref:hypothetical protein n=1 Tax=Luteimonas sp. 3794 TaxID=2817730 RepID=UPI0028553545|nr:hypothetical protein [Luteimonas sp. 3794]MDR6992477.1 hypothetical protein [Luteimonas sp. 3794]